MKAMMKVLMERAGSCAAALLLAAAWLIPQSAWCQVPECPANRPGVCFERDATSSIGRLVDSEGDILIIFNDTGESQIWWRVLPDGTRVRQSWGERDMNFCPSGTATFTRCRDNPPAGAFVGTGRVSAMATEGGNGNCPTAVHIRGSGINGFGDSAEFTGEYVVIRDPETDYCRTLTLEVDGTVLP